MSPKEIAKAAKAGGFPAIALTDRGNMFGALEFSQACISLGVQPIVGCELSVSTQHAGNSFLDNIVLLAKSEAGYQQLCRAVSSLHLDHASEALPLDRIEGSSEIVCLWGGGETAFPSIPRIQEVGDYALRTAVSLKEKFGDNFYIELQQCKERFESVSLRPLVDAAYKLEIPIVAANDVYFEAADDASGHHILRCVGSGRYLADTSFEQRSDQHFLKSSAEMRELWSDVPEAIHNSVEIAKRCAFGVSYKKPILPRFPLDDGETESDRLRKMAQDGLSEKLKHILASVPENERVQLEQKYLDRFDFEFSTLDKMGFCGYYLIVSDFMVWANEQRIPIGVRGSGATSLLAWCMGITHLDPIRFNLVFERFLNPERVSLPDFDVDFCQKQRSKVIDYVVEKYGHDCVCQIITFGKLQAKASVRDAGRVIQAPYGLVDKISKLVGDAKTIGAAIDDEPDLADLLETDETARDVVENARKIEGKFRNISTHAAGVIISDKPVVNYLPLYKDASSEMPLTQFHFKDAEAVGLVKFDFLGLRTLTIIAEAVNLVEQTHGKRIVPLELEFEDKEVFEMLASADSTGVFQLESPGMRELLKSMKPSQIEHLIALISLYRPGPMDSIPSYVARANGEEPVEYDHPLLEDVLNETYGIVTYQEDVMRIARDLGGYSLGEADLLRRAMGKKIVSEMDKHRKKFCDGAHQRGVPESVSNLIFDKCAKFAGYGFNKGHAAAYAQVSFQTAYLKFYYPVQFYCACMNVDIDSYERLRLYCNELKRKKIVVLPPCINHSNADFAVEQSERQIAIRYGLAGVRNFGKAAGDCIAQERLKKGQFTSIEDFFKRTSTLGISRSGYHQLLLAGAFKCFGKDPRHISEQLDVLIANGRSEYDAEENDQASLFGARVGIEPTRLGNAACNTTELDLEGELSSLGFFLSAHPLEIQDLGWSNANISISDIQKNVGDKPKSNSIFVRIDSVQFRTSKNSGKKYAYVMLSDPSGELECMAFERDGVLRAHPDDAGKIVRANVEYSHRDGRNFFSLRGWTEAKSNKKLEALKFFAETEEQVRSLRELISTFAPGGVKVLVEVNAPQQGIIEIDTGQRLNIDMQSYSSIAKELWELSPEAIH